METLMFQNTKSLPLELELSHAKAMGIQRKGPFRSVKCNKPAMALPYRCIYKSTAYAI
jgi:hypothetical protein